MIIINAARPLIQHHPSKSENKEAVVKLESVERLKDMIRIKKYMIWRGRIGMTNGLLETQWMVVGIGFDRRVPEETEKSTETGGTSMQIKTPTFSVI